MVTLLVFQLAIVQALPKMKHLSYLLTVMLLTNHTLASNLKILGTPDGGTHPEPCALTCSGVASYQNEDHPWRSYVSGTAFKRIDYSECGFVSSPVITATLSGGWLGQCPSIFIERDYVTKVMFTVQTVENRSADDMVASQCGVHWSAFGYDC